MNIQPVRTEYMILNRFGVNERFFVENGVVVDGEPLTRFFHGWKMKDLREWCVNGSYHRLRISEIGVVK